MSKVELTRDQVTAIKAILVHDSDQMNKDRLYTLTGLDVLLTKGRLKPLLGAQMNVIYKNIIEIVSILGIEYTENNTLQSLVTGSGRIVTIEPQRFTSKDILNACNVNNDLGQLRKVTIG